MRPDVPAVAGVLTAGQVAETAASIAAMQEPDGAIPWTAGQHTDVWNHVEAAMALLVGGQVAAAERAYDWCAATQRPDGSWPMKTVAGRVEDASGESNMTAYLAVGVWHHWLVRRDVGFVRRLWPVVRDGLDWVVARQLGFGGIAWAQEWDGDRPGRLHEEALVAGSSSIYQSLRAGVALAELMDAPQPEWEIAGGRLGHALREHREQFLDKSEFSMDWYYPVLGGAVRDEAGRALIDSRWDDFVEPGLGIRCVLPNPWVTGAETCELVLALDALGDRERALRLLADMQHLRAPDGGYWTGYVFADEAIWPAEHTTYTAAAVVLAADALGHGTPGSDIMRGATLAGHFAELALECGCPSEETSADGVSGDPTHAA
ncbi:prenyltransferase [Nocardioides donggukensis]|uniref:Prenyltransferase n=1 Tax=Nocardioides donggukensis TaxID=2774019 RepID=A0A927K877_9ACTN|nr:prenyltransferase [Nocardioides donggukensis]MBD8869576.1 prenyltransferase [Nocardioides donggukensis]